MKPSNNIIVDYKPEETFLLPEYYEAIKDKQPGVPFEMEDKTLAINLVHLDMIKREEIRISREDYDGEPEEYLLNNTKFTGNYLLSPKGIYKIAYEKQVEYKERIKKKTEWIQFWIPVFLSGIAVVISIISLFM